MKHSFSKFITGTLILSAAPVCMAQEIVEGSQDVVVVESPRPGAATEIPASRRLDPREYDEMERIRVSSATQVRRFHEVLDELLAEFGYDVKMGQINGLKNLSIRNVEVSRAIPDTYQQYVELLVTERIRENARIRLISCLPCRSRTSRLVEGKLLISSPRTNIETLTRAANQLGVDYFMDVVLVYHSTHMVLAFQVFNADSKELVWARTYNSETVRSRYQRLAVDYSQVERGRLSDEYVPEYRILVGLGGASIPNVGGGVEDSAMMNLHLRGTEKFNNRRNEFGLLMSLYIATNSFISAYPSQGAGGPPPQDDQPIDDISDPSSEPVDPKPFRQAIGLYGFYAYNFLGPLESYNKTRYGLNAGLGILLASGYLAPSVRLGADAYFGRRFAATLGLILITPSQVIVDGERLDTAGGGGFEVGFAVNF